MTQTDWPTDLSAIVIDESADPSTRLHDCLDRLARENLRFEYADDCREAERLANVFDSDVVLIAGHRHGHRAEQILDRVYAWPNDPAIVVLTDPGRGGNDSRRHGPHVYLDTGTLDPDTLQKTIHRAIERLNIRRSNSGNEDSPIRATATTLPLPDGDFVPHYQPIYNLNDESLQGVEMLARWQSPDRGPLRPADIVPPGQRTNLFSDIGDSLLDQGLRQFRQLTPTDPCSTPLSLHINLNGMQLADPRTIGRIEQLVDGETPDTAICLEVTEPALHDHHRRLTQLRDAGHRIFIDDFGTGFSALRKLKDVDIDGLKIDISFIHGMDGDPADAAICEALVALGRRLGITIIAEGVETRQQLDRLRTFGCTAAQGFYLAEPLPFDDLQALIASTDGPIIPG